MSFTVGDKVMIGIIDSRAYASGCSAALDYQCGVVSEIKSVLIPPKPGFISHTVKQICLVDFDMPVKPWHIHSLPVLSFWFPSEDLRLVG